jgi:16S rRNA (guanine527-N7)-methyltransferase
VFGRHILPSLAPLSLFSSKDDDDDDTLKFAPKQQICDVGTGGGFPGLPLAIALPEIDFLLVDSVGKKINAVQDMADRLGLQNVKTFHGRAELLPNKQQFDWVVGRSVAAIPTYAFWVDHLLKDGKSKKKGENDDRTNAIGHLVYLIGGDIDEPVLDLAIYDEDISDLLDCPGVSDKRVLVFPQPAVHSLAVSSGEKLKVPRGSSSNGSSSGSSSRTNNNDRKNNNRRNEKAKGQWKTRDNSAPKQRGYDNFQRFDSFQN